MSCGYNACGTCKTCEGFCEAAATTHSIREEAKNFAGAAPVPTVGADDIIIKQMPREALQGVVNWINLALTKARQARVPDVPTGTGINEFVQAKVINDIVAGLKRLDRRASSPDAQVDKVIYANYFATLFNEIADAHFQRNDCDQCITNCDGACVSMVRVSSCSNCCNAASP